MVSKLVARFMDYATVGATVTVIGVHQALYGPFMSKVQETVQMYRDGFPLKMPPELHTRCKEVLSKLKIAKVDKVDIKFFLVAGDEPYHWGTCETTYGSIVGVPWNFVYKKTDEIDLTDLRVFGDQVVNWDSKSGRQLLETLVMTEKAQKFAIAREVYMTDSMRRLFMPVIFASCVMFARAVVYHINRHPKALEQTRTMRGIGKLLITGIAYFNFVMLRDALHMYYERRSDIRASEVGPDYFDGAMDYYTKLLQRGKAYRKLMGSEGEKYFTPDGDEIRPSWHFLIISRSIPYSDRLKLLNDYRNEHFEVD